MGGGRRGVEMFWVVARTVLLINNANCCCLQKFRTRFELAQPTVRCAARVLCRNFFQAFLLSLRCCCCCCLAASLPALLLAALSVSSHFFRCFDLLLLMLLLLLLPLLCLSTSLALACVCVCVSCGLLMFFSFFSFYVQRAASSGGGYALQFFPIATDFFFSLSPSLYVSARSCVCV